MIASDGSSSDCSAGSSPRHHKPAATASDQFEEFYLPNNQISVFNWGWHATLKDTASEETE